MVHFVIFEKWTSNYEISISILWVHTMCCDIANYFCQKCPIMSFCERLVYFSASSILSKMLNFVIFWEARGFFRFFNFPKMLNFVILWEDLGFFSLLQFCQNCLILSFSERPVYFFASSILSKKLNFVIFWERKVYFFFHFFNFVINGPFCHIWKVDFKLWD